MRTRYLSGMFILLAVTAGGIASATAADANMAEPAAKEMMKKTDPMEAEANAAIDAAKAAQKKASSVQGEWTTVGKLIKKAQSAAKEGDYAGAIKLAGTAADHGNMGYEQAVSQSELRIPSYLKY
jgi:hypothetical protein